MPFILFSLAHGKFPLGCSAHSQSDKGGSLRTPDSFLLTSEEDKTHAVAELILASLLILLDSEDGGDMGLGDYCGFLWGGSGGLSWREWGCFLGVGGIGWSGVSIVG